MLLIKVLLGVGLVPSHWVVQSSFAIAESGTANTHSAQVADSGRSILLRRQGQGVQSASESLLQDESQWGPGYQAYGYPGPYGYPSPQMQGYPYGYPSQEVMPMYAMPPNVYPPSAPSMYTYPPRAWASSGGDSSQAYAPPKQDVPPPTHDWSLDHPLEVDNAQQPMTEDELYMKLDEIAASKGDQGALDRISQALKSQTPGDGEETLSSMVEAPRREAVEALRHSAILDQAMNKIWEDGDQSSAPPDNTAPDIASSLAKSAVELGGTEAATKKQRSRKHRKDHDSKQLIPKDTYESLDTKTEDNKQADTSDSANEPPQEEPPQEESEEAPRQTTTNIARESPHEESEEDAPGQWANWSLGAKDRFWGNWDSVKAIDDSFSSNGPIPRKKDWWTMASDTISLHKMIGKDEDWLDPGHKNSSDTVSEGAVDILNSTEHTNASHRLSSISEKSDHLDDSQDNSISDGIVNPSPRAFQGGNHSEDSLGDDGLGINGDDSLEEDNPSANASKVDMDSENSLEDESETHRNAPAPQVSNHSDDSLDDDGTGTDDKHSRVANDPEKNALSRPTTPTNKNKVTNLSKAAEEVVKPAPEDKRAAEGDGDAMEKLAHEITGEKAWERAKAITTTVKPSIDDDDVSAAASGDDEAMRKLATQMR